MPVRSIGTTYYIYILLPGNTPFFEWGYRYWYWYCNSNLEPKNQRPTDQRAQLHIAYILRAPQAKGHKIIKMTPIIVLESELFFAAADTAQNIGVRGVCMDQQSARGLIDPRFFMPNPCTAV